jgi:hypothetical protein
MKIPKNERPMTRYIFDGIPCYIVTQNPNGKYVLYKILGDDEDYQKMKIADTPPDLEVVIEKDRRK